MIKNKVYMIVSIALLLIITIPAAMADTVTINVDVDGDAYVNVQNDNGTFSVVYNGRDILGELEAAKKSLNDMEKTFIYWHGLTQTHEVEQNLLVVEEQLNNLTRDLNVVLGELYGNLAFTMHVVGINPANTFVAVTLRSGNVTVAGYIDDILVDINEILVELNATDQELASIQSQFENVYAGMMVHETVLIDTVETIETDFDQFVNYVLELQAEDVSLDSKITIEIERKDEQVQQLEAQIELLEKEFEEELDRELKKTRDSMNVISIMFGAFSIIAIGIIAMTRRS
uniref:Uncharacterized protein n=1 Tax=viral metagenome TaxID=1070528 RepID=A0A6M3MDT2_9ZZZZ